MTVQLESPDELHGETRQARLDDGQLLVGDGRELAVLLLARELTALRGVPFRRDEISHLLLAVGEVEGGHRRRRELEAPREMGERVLTPARLLEGVSEPQLVEGRPGVGGARGRCPGRKCSRPLRSPGTKDPRRAAARHHGVERVALRRRGRGGWGRAPRGVCAVGTTSPAGRAAGAGDGAPALGRRLDGIDGAAFPSMGGLARPPLPGAPGGRSGVGRSQSGRGGRRRRGPAGEERAPAGFPAPPRLRSRGRRASAGNARAGSRRSWRRGRRWTRQGPGRPRRWAQANRARNRWRATAARPSVCSSRSSSSGRRRPGRSAPP